MKDLLHLRRVLLGSRSAMKYMHLCGLLGMRYAVRFKQISDNVLCQRSAVVISADAFQSTLGNVFHAMYDARRDSNTVIEPLVARSITIFSTFFEKIAENITIIDKMEMISNKLFYIYSVHAIPSCDNYKPCIIERSPLSNFTPHEN